MQMSLYGHVGDQDELAKIIEFDCTTTIVRFRLFFIFCQEFLESMNHVSIKPQNRFLNSR